MGEKLKSMLLVIVNRHPENSQLGIQFVQKWLRKDPTPFVKVVEGQEIYNFVIHCLDHFCSTF
jgi:hypothetical protein